MPGKVWGLSGAEVTRILEGFGFRIERQRGSYVKLRRVGADGRRQILHAPLHAELKTGTLHAIVRQASEYVAIEELRPHFFVD